MTPHTKSLDEILEYAETQIRTFHLPKELTNAHVYIRIIAQKRNEGRTRQYNDNEKTVVYEILETYDFLQRNRYRLEYIQAYHQLRLFGYDLWIQTSKAMQEPVNIERDMKIEITTCKRMITKIENAISTIDAEASKTLFPSTDENSKKIKLKEKLTKYHSRLNTAIADLDRFHYSITV
jgi:hypothetical protein